MCDSGRFLSEVVGGLEISTEEPDLAVYISLQQGSPIRTGELAMNCYGGCASNSCYLPRSFTTLFESADRAMKDNEICQSHRVAIASAIDMLEALFFELVDQVFVKRNLEFSRQDYFVRLNHLDLNCPRLNFCGLA